MGNKLHPNQIKLIVEHLFLKEYQEGNPTHIVNDNGQQYKSQKVNDNDESEVKQAVNNAFTAWKEKNKLLDFQDWQNEMNNLFSHCLQFSKSKEINRKIKIYQSAMQLVKDVKENQKVKKQVTEKYSTVDQRLYILSELAPEFINSLSKLTRVECESILSMITNSNPVDCYKKIRTKQSSDLSKDNFDSEFTDKIDKIKTKLMK
jgi:hypothetical protein